MANTELYFRPARKQRTMRVRLVMEIDPSDWQVLRDINIDRVVARQRAKKADK
ncbi:MAG: hypothetical protein R3E66_18045 [bacterium]